MIAIFAALYAALRLIPTVPMIGTGATFHLSDILAPLYGILLGPLVGGVSIIFGTFVAIALGSTMPFLGLDFLPAFVVAVSLGLLVRKKWLPVVILNAVLLLLYALDPFTVNFIVTPWGAVPYLWMHIAGFIVLLSPLGRKAGEWIRRDTTTKREKRTRKSIYIIAGGIAVLIIGAVALLWGLTISGTNSIVVSSIGAALLIVASGVVIYKAKVTKLTAGFAILAFIGTMMQHLTGGLLYETVFGNILGSMDAAAFATTWNIVFYIYPWERFALIIGAVVVGVPVTRALKKFLFTNDNNAALKTSAQ